MNMIQHIPLPRNIQTRVWFWKVLSFLFKIGLIKKAILPVITEMLARDNRELKYWNRIHSRARIQLGYHNSLNGGRDQDWWLEKVYNETANFLEFGRPPKWMYIQQILDDEETPIWLRFKTNLFVLMLRVNYLMSIKVPVWKCLLPLVLVSSALIILLIV